MKISINLSGLFLVASLVFVNGGKADVLDTPTANLTERWISNDAGWVIKDYVMATTRPVILTNDTIGVTFASRNPTDFPAPEMVGVSGTGAASSGRFVGDYNLRGIESVSFLIRTVNLSKCPTFYFKSASGKKWYVNLDDIPFTTGSSGVSKVVALVFSADWKTSSSSSYLTLANFESDKGSVVEIGIGVERFTELAQQVSIDNLKLIGPWGGPYTDKNVSVAWLLENNVTASASDSDGDGFSDVSEYMAGTDPNNSNSFFRVEIGRNASGKTVVKWTENKYLYFDLMQTTNLMDVASFETVSNATDLPGSGAIREIVVNDSEAGVKFYKVVIKPSPSGVK